MGCKCRKQKARQARIVHLLDSPAAVRFLSIEPLLEHLGALNLSGISWVIVGGESGAGARPIERQWVIDIRDQCRRARVPFFFKHWSGIRKKENGRMLNGRTYDEFPHRRLAHVPSISELDSLRKYLDSF